VADIRQYPLRLLAVFSLILSAGCKDRLFDNPFDPQAGEIVFEIINTVYTPAIAPRGMTWDGSTLWNVDGSGDTLLSLNASNGTLVRTLKSPLFNTADIAYDGLDLWVCSESDVNVYRINVFSGDVQKRLNLQRGSFTAMEYGLGFLWLADAQSNKILKVNPETAEVLASFPNPGVRAGGLAFDGSHFWISDPRTLSIYETGLDGQVLRKYLSPGQSPQGLAFDGRFLWNVDANQKLYQLRF
jgi:DNA-binding beta-propeller fold protein YncE